MSRKRTVYETKLKNKLTLEATIGGSTLNDITSANNVFLICGYRRFYQTLDHKRSMGVYSQAGLE